MAVDHVGIVSLGWCNTITRHIGEYGDVSFLQQFAKLPTAFIKVVQSCNSITLRHKEGCAG